MMTFILAHRPLLAILVSLAAIPLIIISRRRPNLREFWTLAAAFLKALIVFSMLPTVLSGQVIESASLILSPTIDLHLRVDAAGLLFACIASFLWILTSFYSIGYMRSTHETHQTGYYVSFALCLSSTIGIAFAGNLLTFIIFFEILTIATYPLVVHKRNDTAIKAGRRYLAYTLISGQLTLIGIILIYAIYGGGDFVPGGFLSPDNASPLLLTVLFILLMMGPLVKAGLMPFHGWLPDAMIAPTPVSALLHAVAVVKAGCFGVLRMMGYVFGPATLAQMSITDWLGYIAAFTIIAASLIALTKPDLKQRLAYSTVGQLSYIILGMTLLLPISIIGAVFHLFAHAIMKITLFFTAGAIYTKTHDLTITKLSGLGRTMPLTFAAYTFCALGIAGMPFTVGFISKWNLLLGAINAGQWWCVVVLIISALLTCGYLLPVAWHGFRGEVVPEMAEVKGEPNKLCLVPLLITCGLALLFGVLPNFGGFYHLAELIASNIMTGSF